MLSPLKYLASNIDLAHFAIQKKPEEWNILDIDAKQNLMYWLKCWGTIHYLLYGKKRQKNDTNKLFDPWCYIAGYPHTLRYFWDTENNTLDEESVCFVWITYGQPSGFESNQFEMTHSAAELCLKAQNKNIYIIGNSRELPFHLHQLPDLHNPQNIVIGFNNVIHHFHCIDFHYILCNDVIFDKNKRIKKCKCITEFLTDQDEYQFELTTGLHFIKWILDFVDFQHLFIAGFNMVDHGEQAHFFDNETPALPTDTFAGHNKAFEHKFLKQLDQQHDQVTIIFS